MEPADSPETLAFEAEELERSLQTVLVGEGMNAETRQESARRLDGIAAGAEKHLLLAVAGLRGADAAPVVQTRDAAASLFRAIAARYSWIDGKTAQTELWLDRAAAIAVSKPLIEKIAKERRGIHDARDFADVFALCSRGKVEKARRMLRARRRSCTDPEVRERIDAILAEPRRMMGPVGSVPGLFTLNSLGTGMYGSRNPAPDGTSVATLCACVLFLPIFPIRAYVVAQDGNQWQFFGRVPLSGFAIWSRRVLCLALVSFILGFVALPSYRQSNSVRETQRLETARQAIERCDYANAVSCLLSVAPTRDAKRRAQVDTLARRALRESLAACRTAEDVRSFLRAIAGQLRFAGVPEWYSDEVWGQLERTVLALVPLGGEPCRDLLDWAGTVSPTWTPRRLALSVKACATADDASFLAATARWHHAERQPCPRDIVRRLGESLLRVRHDGWDADAIAYLSESKPPEAMPVLLARSEAAWKGSTSGSDLIPFVTHELLLALLRLDEETDLEKRAAGLEKIADPKSLTEPQRTWHRLGVSRRLANLYWQLNERDPIRYPIAKARPWAVAAADLAPEDVPLRVMAMRCLLADGEFDQAIFLGAKPSGDERIVPLLGIAYARAGRLEEAEKVLQPYVARHFQAYVQAFGAWERDAETLARNLRASLQDGSGDQALIRRLNSLPPEEADREVRAWILARCNGDAKLSRLAEVWRAHADVAPAAGDLGMVELSLGRGLPPGEKRNAKLAEAERIFLDLRKVSGDDPHQELQLAQVYFWLGRESEGQAIFDRLETTEDGRLLLEMGALYRDLLRPEAARRVLEKAFTALPQEEKPLAAAVRAMASEDGKDKLVWLERCGAGPYVQSEIVQTRGEILIGEGRYSEAVDPLKKAAAFYANQPESDTVLNNAATVQDCLFVATGDARYLLECRRLQRRSMELSKQQGIVTSNYVHVLRCIGILALLGDSLRVDLLHRTPTVDWLAFVAPQPSRAEWARRAKAQSDLRGAAEAGAQSSMLSSEDQGGYEARIEYLTLTLDADGLRAMRESLEAAPPVRPETAARNAARRKGEFTAVERAYTEKERKRLEIDLPRIREAGHAPTLALALTRLARQEYAAEVVGAPEASMDRAAAYAEEAFRNMDNSETRRTRWEMRAEQASRSLAEEDTEYRKWVETSRDAASSLRLWLYSRSHSVGSLKEIGEIAQEIAESKRDTWALCEWLWLALAGHPRAEEAREKLVESGLSLERHRIEWILNPGSSNATVGAFAAATAFGDAALRERIASEARRLGVLTPAFRP